MRSIVLIAHNLRSCHNIGSLLRTAEGLGVKTVYLTGYSPYPSFPGDKRLPHVAQKITRQINKTALGAENSATWIHHTDIFEIIRDLQAQKYTIAALEQTATAVSLPDWTPPQKVALLLGREVEGIEDDVLRLCNTHVQIPMLGKKESFNVVQAAAMGLYHCRFR